ncbi:MAG: phosphoribosyl-AMP cyclohydrolase [Thermodesulfobacteriota bacterium]|nr:phosphoribosyl-AMP cyclohydrolase [Thermodesulfobacteriota bacterium]
MIFLGAVLVYGLKKCDRKGTIMSGMKGNPISLDFSKGGGLLPAIAQDHASGKVLMLAYINEAAWQKTLETGEAHYWSRTRQEIWHKGGTSGHVQKIREIYADCDNDTVLFKVDQIGGAACHTGHETCFHQRVERDGSVTVVGERIFDPEKVYGK